MQPRTTFIPNTYETDLDPDICELVKSLAWRLADASKPIGPVVRVFSEESGVPSLESKHADLFIFRNFTSIIQYLLSRLAKRALIECIERVETRLSARPRKEPKLPTRNDRLDSGYLSDSPSPSVSPADVRSAKILNSARVGGSRGRKPSTPSSNADTGDTVSTLHSTQRQSSELEQGTTAACGYTTFDGISGGLKAGAPTGQLDILPSIEPRDTSATISHIMDGGTVNAPNLQIEKHLPHDSSEEQGATSSHESGLSRSKEGTDAIAALAGSASVTGNTSTSADQDFSPEDGSSLAKQIGIQRPQGSSVSHDVDSELETHGVIDPAGFANETAPSPPRTFRQSTRTDNMELCVGETCTEMQSTTLVEEGMEVANEDSCGGCEDQLVNGLTSAAAHPQPSEDVCAENSKRKNTSPSRRPFKRRRMIEDKSYRGRIKPTTSRDDATSGCQQASNSWLSGELSQQRLDALQLVLEVARTEQALDPQLDLSMLDSLRNEDAQRGAQYVDVVSQALATVKGSFKAATWFTYKYRVEVAHLYQRFLDIRDSIDAKRDLAVQRRRYLSTEGIPVKTRRRYAIYQLFEQVYPKASKYIVKPRFADGQYELLEDQGVKSEQLIKLELYLNHGQAAHTLSFGLTNFVYLALTAKDAESRLSNKAKDLKAVAPASVITLAELQKSAPQFHRFISAVPAEAIGFGSNTRLALVANPPPCDEHQIVYNGPDGNVDFLSYDISVSVEQIAQITRITTKWESHGEVGK